jgi:hypothetical protein
VVVAPAGNCAFPMRDSDFSGAKSSVSKQSFDDNKLKIAKQIVGSNCLTSAQVKELVGLMTYENNKVELAKHCYKFTYDPNNYFMVYDAFTYKSSTDELSKFIGR